MIKYILTWIFGSEFTITFVNAQVSVSTIYVYACQALSVLFCLIALLVFWHFLNIFRGVI